MKNTMTNDYKRRIEIYIMWCIRKEDKNLHTSSPRKKMEYFIKRFNAEFNTNYEKVMFPVLQTRISEYLKGLPYDIAYTFSGIIEIAKKLHQTNEFTKKEEDKIIENWFDHLALHILRLCRKYNLILR